MMLQCVFVKWTECLFSSFPLYYFQRNCDHRITCTYYIFDHFTPPLSIISGCDGKENTLFYLYCSVKRLWDLSLGLVFWCMPVTKKIFYIFQRLFFLHVLYYEWVHNFVPSLRFVVFSTTDTFIHPAVHGLGLLFYNTIFLMHFSPNLRFHRLYISIIQQDVGALMFWFFVYLHSG